MPLTTGVTSLRAAKGEGHIHSDKWRRCIEHVKANSPDVEPHAVCTHSIGYAGSVNPGHRTEGRHASANPKRFQTKAGQRSARARERAAKQGFLSVLKWEESQHPRDTDGQFTERGSGSSSHLSPAQQAMQDELAKQEKKPVHKVTSVEEGIALILKGENVELQDTKDVHTVLKKLGELAIEAKAAGSQAVNFDPCHITVKGTSFFCGEKLKTADFPHGIPRVEMPQFKSKNPVPGSDADKHQRDRFDEVDATSEFVRHLHRGGVRSHHTTILARKLKASQAEMEGAKVADLMLHPERDPKKSKITVSRDGYVVDGHHTWAAAIGRDAEDGNLDNDKEMKVVMIDLPMSQIYHLSVAWTKAYGLPQAGVKKQDYGFILKSNPYHDKGNGQFTYSSNTADTIPGVRGKTAKHVQGKVESYGLRLTKIEKDDDGTFIVTVEGDRSEIEHFSRDNEG